MSEFNAHGQISKIDDDKRQVFGWASVTDLNGEPVVDHQDDWMAAEELEKAVYDYVLKSRVGGTMHERVGKSQPKATSEMIESFVITPEKIEKMGLPEGSLPLGWWTGFQVRDEDTWRDVKKGKLTSFSIHGVGKREKVAKESLMSKRKRHEEQLAEVYKSCGGDEVLFTKAVAYLADTAHEIGHHDAPFYAEVVKHLIGRHDQQDHDPTKGEGRGHTRADHDTFGQARGLGAVGASAGALGGAAGGALGSAATGMRPLPGALGGGARWAALGGLAGAVGGAISGAREGGQRAEQRNERRARRSAQGSAPSGRMTVVDAARERFGMDEEELMEFMGRTGATDLDDVASYLEEEKRQSTSKRLTQREKDIISKYMGVS